MSNNQNLLPILTKVTYHAKDSIVTDDHFFINGETYETSSSGKYKNGKFNYIDSLEFIASKKNNNYFRVIKPIWSIEFIEEIENNVRINDNEYCNKIEMLFETISDYGGDCGVSKIIKDVEKYFDKNWANKNGIEVKKFITIFYEWSYWDSYAGDGDYGIEYEKISNLNNLQEDIKIPEECVFMTLMSKGTKGKAKFEKGYLFKKL